MRHPRFFWLLPAFLTLFACGDETTNLVGPDENPVPAISSISPDWVVSGSGTVEVTVRGTGFVPGTMLIFDGEERPTTADGDTLLTSTLLVRDTAGRKADSEHLVWLRNPAPGGGTSAGFPFPVLDSRPVPQADEVNPAELGIGEPDTQITIYGYYFHESSVVRADEVDLESTYVSSRTLRAMVPASVMAAADTVVVTVFTGGPGGGTSEGISVPVVEPRPAPRVDSVTPDVVPIAAPGVSDYTFMLNGENFHPECEVWIDDSKAWLMHWSPTQLRATTTNSYFHEGGFKSIVVHVPGPGGGSSDPVEITVENPVPVIESLEPGALPVGAHSHEMEILGEGFSGSSLVLFNGVTIYARRSGYGRLVATVPGFLIESLDDSTVEVINPEPGGGHVSAAVQHYERVTIGIKSNDVVYDRPRDRILASIPFADGTLGNSIAALDPDDGNILSSVFVGGDPTTLAISDNHQFLYVALDETGFIRRYDLATDAVDLDFDVGTALGFGKLFAGTMEVAPGQPGTLAVLTHRKLTSRTEFGGLSVFFDGAKRFGSTGTSRRLDHISFMSADSLIGFYGSSSLDELYRIAFTQDTISISNGVRNVLLGNHDTDFDVVDHILYANNGQMIDAANLDPIVTLPITGHSSAMPGSGEVFYAAEKGYSSIGGIDVYDTATHELLRTLHAFVLGQVREVIRTGRDELALVTEDEIVILRSPILEDAAW